MSLVQLMTPINLQEEKRKFFEKDCNYNPQFKYSDLVTLNKLYKYGKPKPEYLELAQKILDEAFNGRTEAEIREMEGEKLSKQEGQKMIAEFLEENGLENRLKVNWIKGHISKSSVYKDEFKLRDNFDYRRKNFKATLYHEIGTHFLRRINYVEQPFYRKKRKLGFKQYLPTEEGLASLHSLLASNCKLDYYHALTYLATEIARKSSFVKTFEFVNQYLQDKQRSWRLTVKFKRGLYDTSEKGGFTKSTVYLEGIVEVYQYLKNNNFDVKGLYFGKISTKDVPRAQKMNPEYQPILPSFYQHNISSYIKSIKSIARTNFLAD